MIAPMDVPHWPEGTAAVLSTADADGRPHAIPVSSAVRTGATTVHLSLGRRRASLANLRRDPRAALTVLAGDDLALTLHGWAKEVDGDVEGTVALRFDVEHVQDHLQPTFTIESAVGWRWTDPAAAERDRQIREALHEL
jgi:nitroimidazol reductase NimA-like FMN-containing flavoprotein (pyridoxamine 5'-phosphate oxidase superfamily)